MNSFQASGPGWLKPANVTAFQQEKRDAPDRRAEQAKALGGFLEGDKIPGICRRYVIARQMRAGKSAYQKLAVSL